MDKRKSIPTAVLLLALLLSPAVPALAAPADGAAPGPLSADRAPLVWLHDLLTDFGSSVTSAWSKLGQGIDPDGAPSATGDDGLSDPEAQLGGGIDPNGAPSTTGDDGLPEPEAQLGHGIDPNG